MIKRILATAAAFAALIIVSSCAGVSSGNSYKSPDFTGSSLSTSEDAVKSDTATKGEVKAYDLTKAKTKVDSNADSWKVCSQSVDPGKNVQKSSTIKLGVVPIEEECPAPKTYSKKAPEKGSTVKDTVGVTKSSGTKSEVRNYANRTASQAIQDISKTLPKVTIYTSDAITGETLASHAGKVVCASRPKAGETITESSVIVFYVADTSKTCLKAKF